MHLRRKGLGQEVQIRVPELRLQHGSLAVVLGPNGSGKSTLFDMLALILSSDRVDRFDLYDGERTLNLCAVSRQQGALIRRRYFAYVLQTGGLLDFLTVGENIRFAARLSGKSPRRIDEVTASLGLQGLLAMHPGQVSGGQRRRAALARALVQEPRILLADEPTADLDSASARIVLDAFRELARSYATSVLMVTHDEALVHGRADAIYRFVSRPAGHGVSVSTLESRSPHADRTPKRSATDITTGIAVHQEPVPQYDVAAMIPHPGFASVLS
ncbi:ATP-binding cassette domain-containing protein [Candidatus Thiodictyon syntrophicum]|nr:ATP-binding cassette domain-containing protein [Candidatus Thiodictyon syntrophicum]